MEPELIQQILFWAAVVFIAGFIGYFGKYLSKLILGKIHKKGPYGSKESAKPMSKREYDYNIEKQKLKMEKKRMKAEEKRKEKEAERREKMRERRED